MMTRFNIPLSSSGLPLADDERLEFCRKEFYLLCPSEASCRDLLFQHMFPNGAKCRCGCTKIKRQSGSRSFECCECKTITWFTVGTIFEGLHKLLPRLLHIVLTENGVNVSVLEFARIAKIDPNTARKIFGQVTTVIEHEMRIGNVTRDANGNGVLMVPSKGLIDVFSRHSFDTIRGEGPKSEQLGMELEEAARLANEQALIAMGIPVIPSTPPMPVRPPDKMIIEKALEEALVNPPTDCTDSILAIYRLLSDKPMSFDQMCIQTDMEAGHVSACITDMKLANLIESTASDWFVRVDFPIVGATAVAVRKFIDFVKGTFIGIARKYLQKYLAYWWYIKRVDLHNTSLLDKCLEFGPIEDGMPTSYKTNLFVRLAA